MSVELPAGTRVGPYVVLERLGAGGMGEVYLGRDSRLHRKVALKCLLASAEGNEQHERILHEARAVARINHGNVAVIHDVIDDGLRAYIVMEYVEGENLAVRLRRGRLPADEVLSIGRQLLSALASAHAVGVVHRDLKPANIQITPSGTVKVLDFGIARSSAPMLMSSSAMTETGPPAGDVGGKRAGTPAYMAPEQMLGAAVDQRCDLYSLGVVMFEAATGRRPYEYVDPVELLQLPASLAPRADAVDPAFPAGLADLLEKALQCHPEKRFQSADEFDRAIVALQQQRTRWRPTRRESLSLLGVAFGGAAGAIVWDRCGPRQPVGSARRYAIAVLPFVNLSGDPSQDYFADGLTDGLINALGSISAVSVKARTSVMKFKGAGKSAAEIAAVLKADIIVEGSALLRSNHAEIVRVVVNVVDPATQTPLWSTALERELHRVMTIYADLARDIITSLNVSLSAEDRRRLGTAGQAVDPETFKLYLLGRHEWSGRTAPQLQQALKYFHDATTRSPNYAPAYAGMADAYALLTGEFAAMPRAEGAAQAIAHASRALGIDPTLAEAYTSLAFANFFLQWDFTAAGQQFEQALALNASYATAHHWYGNYLSDMGYEERGLAEIRRALELDPLSPIISRDVAWPLFFSGRYEEAIAQLDSTLDAFPRFLPAERLRARALGQRGEHAEAIRQFEEQKLRADTPRARCELAWAYALAGRRERAIAELRSAEATAAGFYPYDAALVYVALNLPDQALDALERAFSERDPTMVNLRHDPRLAALRGDVRYQRLVAQMRFPPQ